MPTKKRAADPTEVTVRLIQKCQSTSPGAVQVLGAYYRAMPLGGLNGERGFQVGHYERWLGVEGPFTLDLPNTAGPDGKLHIDRFLRGPGRGADPKWMPGDEWIEIRRDNPPTLLYVGAYVNEPSVTPGKVQLGGYDAWWLSKLVRETSAGFWCHAPRDVLEHYTRAWVFDVATGFPEPGAATVTTDAATVAGSFTYTRARTNTGLPVARLLPRLGGLPPGPHSLMTLNTTPPNVGYQSPDPYEPWRAETSVYVSQSLATATNAYVFLGNQIGLSVQGSTSATSGLTALLYDGVNAALVAPVPGGPILPGQLDLAVEGRERWIYFYVNGQLVGVAPMPASVAAINTVSYESTNASGTPANVDVQSFTYERGRKWLMRGSDKGDYTLPGKPAIGGLFGEFFDDSDLRRYVGTSQNLAFQLNPTRTPYATRPDPQINFTVAGPPPTWQPPGPASGELFSARWTGAIYLDLKNYDYRIQSVADDAMRIWVGKTRFGEQVVDAWTLAPGAVTSAYLRTILGQVSGWYPIRVEYANILGGGAATVSYERSDVPGTFAAVPATMLSPEGIYTNQVRGDSHYDTFTAVAQAFGYQFTTQPYSLESGLFPGQVIPRVRVGRDVDVKVTSGDSTDLALTSLGEDMAMRIVADAAGIADPNGTAQLSATAVNFANATNHMFTLTQAESLAAITDPTLLAQRLNSLLTLRSGTWDQVSSRPQGHPQLAGAWPPDPTLPVLPARYAWEPGDAPLRNYPELGVIDTVPTQLMQVSWDVSPHGIVAPQAQYFIYPRGVWWTLRRFRQDAVAAKRNYQGQLAKYPGTPGGITGTATGSPATFAADRYARLALPANQSKGGRVWLKVTRKLDRTIQWTIEVNGVDTAIPVNSVGEYEVSAYAAVFDPAVRQEMYARLIITTAAPYDTAEYVLITVPMI